MTQTDNGNRLVTINGSPREKPVDTPAAVDNIVELYFGPQPHRHGVLADAGENSTVTSGVPGKAMEGLIVNRRVLMLNQNYEPLTVCSARRAVVLMFQGKAEMIEKADGQRLRTVSRSYALPSVVRLWQYRKVPHKRIILTRKNILTRDKHRCQYCGGTRGPMTVDHVVPRRLGGRATWENLVCACSKCNNRKGDHTPEEAGLKLLRKPTRPTYITFIQRNYVVSTQWRPYLFIDSSIGGATT